MTALGVRRSGLKDTPKIEIDDDLVEQAKERIVILKTEGEQSVAAKEVFYKRTVSKDIDINCETAVENW